MMPNNGSTVQGNPGNGSAPPGYGCENGSQLTERVYFEGALRALTLENGRMRSELHMYQTHVFNCGRTQQQATLLNNTLQQNLQQAQQAQSEQERLSTRLAYERDQAATTVISFNQVNHELEMSLRQEQSKVMKMYFLLTCLNGMKSEDLVNVLSDEADITNIMEKYMTEDEEVNDEDLKGTITIGYYRQLLSKAKDRQRHLEKILAEKESAYCHLQAAFDELEADLYAGQTEEDVTVETAEVGTVVRASQR